MTVDTVSVDAYQKLQSKRTSAELNKLFTEVFQSFSSELAFQLVPHNILDDIMVTKANSNLDISSVEVPHSVVSFSATRTIRLSLYYVYQRDTSENNNQTKSELYYLQILKSDKQMD